MKRIATLALVAILSLTACGPVNTTPGTPGSGPSASTVAGFLEAALDAAAAAYATLNPAAAPVVALVTSCGSAAVTELSTSDSGSVKATKIGASCAAALTAAKQGGPTVQIIASALSAFLNAIIPLEGGTAPTALATRSTPPMTISATDAARLNGKIATLTAQLAKR